MTIHPATVRDMKNIVEAENLQDREFVFADRNDAGRQLAALMRTEAESDSLLLPIPAGGVPVALALRPQFPWPLELLLVRKVQIPWNSEAGFGAVNLDGDRLFNEPLLRSLNLSEEVVESQVLKALRTLTQRNSLFRQDRPFADLSGKKAIIVDDGLASGYTMLAALRYVRRRRPAAVLVAAPTGLRDTVEHIAEEADRVYCANIREGYPFAVANAYRHWYDVSDEELVRALEDAGY